MKLDLNIDKLAGPGRRAIPVDYEILRPLNEADLHALQTVPANSVPNQLQRITDRHHSLARLLAAGTKPGEAALILGYEPSRVSTLMNSPAFQELLALYQGEVKHEFSTTIEHMAGLSRDVLAELRTRIEDAPDRFSVNELRALLVDTVDRVSGAEEITRDMPTILFYLPGPMQSGTATWTD